MVSVTLARAVMVMAEIMAQLRWIWIEHGDTVAAVILVVSLSVLAIVALRKGSAENDNL